jgi:hypothetical protein
MATIILLLPLLLIMDLQDLLHQDLLHQDPIINSVLHNFA